MSVKFNGKEIRNPVLRVLAVIFLVVFTSIWVTIAFILLFVLFFLSLPVRIFSPRLANKICKVTIR